ncbi:MAG: DUF3540 domain-containing protein [Pirellulaceae bacterium]
MLTANAETLCGITANGYLGPAEVCEIRDGAYYLSIPGTIERLAVAGTLAIPGRSDIRVGSRVLVAAQHLDDVYIIGVLELSADASHDSTQHNINLQPNDKVRVFSENRDLLFEHDSSLGVTRIHVPVGDLEFIANHGNIRFESAGVIQLYGADAVQVRSKNAIRLGVEDQTGLARSEYVLGSRDQRIETPQLRVRTASLQAQASETRFTSQTLRGRFGSVRIVAQTIESVADTLIRKAKNSFARVTGLWQVKSEQISCESRSSMHLKSKNAYIKSEDDMKIDGQQIHLG